MVIINLLYQNKDIEEEKHHMKISESLGQLTTTGFRTLKHIQHGIAPLSSFFITVRVFVL